MSSNADMKQTIASVIADYSAQGIHRTGTACDIASAEWLAEQVARAGFTPTLTKFDLQRFDCTEAYLDCGDFRVEGIPCFDGPDGDIGVAGSLCAADSEGDILITSAASLESNPLSESNPMSELCRQGSYQAIVVAAPEKLPQSGITLANAENFRNPHDIPVLQVAAEDRERLLSICGKQVELVMHTRYVSTVGINVGAKFAGEQSELAPLVVMTPRSGWWRCASERGGGLAAWLLIMQSLAERGSLRPVIFTANTGHELCHLGYDAFIAHHSGLEGGAHAWMHLGANFAAVPPVQILLHYSDAGMQNLAREAAETAGVSRFAERLSERPGGEVQHVYDSGGRYIAIFGPNNARFHHPEDCWPDAVDLPQAVRACQMLVTIALKLSR